MSYDLMVFDPAVAPKGRAEFKAWFEKVVDWSDDDSSYDPATSSPILRAWYEAMLPDWPNMQEVDDDNTESLRITGYTFCPHAIYVDFRWSVAEEAYDATRATAMECGVGFYDVSDDGDAEMYFPGDELRPPSNGRWRQVAADFRSGDVSKYVPKAVSQNPPKRGWSDFFRKMT